MTQLHFGGLGKNRTKIFNEENEKRNTPNVAIMIL